MKRLPFIKSLIGTGFAFTSFASISTPSPIIVRGSRPEILQIGEFHNASELHEMFGGGHVVTHYGQDEILSVCQWKVSFKGEKKSCAVVCNNNGKRHGMFATTTFEGKVSFLFGGYTPEEIDILANKGGILV